MNKLLKFLAVLLLATAPVLAQTGQRSYVVNSTTPDIGVGNIGSGIAYHQLTWNVVGSVSACAVTLQQSADDISWTTLIASQSCTTNGQSTVSNVIANYIRIDPTSFTGTAGSSVVVHWNGFNIDPSVGGDISGTISQGQVAFGDSTPDTITSNFNFTFDSANDRVLIPGDGVHTALNVGPDVFGDLDFTNALFGYNVTEPTGDFENVNSEFDMTANYTGDTNKETKDFFSVLDVADSHVHNSTVIGAEVDTELTGTGGSYLGPVFGFGGFVEAASNVSVTGDTYGVEYTITQLGTATLGNVNNFDSILQVNGTGGGISNARGFHVESPQIDGSGAVVSHYHALQIDDPTIGGGTFNPDPWAVYVAAGKSYFGGSIQTSFCVSGCVLVASLTTTAATSDNVTITGMTSSGHCSLTPTNATAIGLITLPYISAKTTNQITVTHAVTANATFDIICAAY